GLDRSGELDRPTKIGGQSMHLGQAVGSRPSSIAFQISRGVSGSLGASAAPGASYLLPISGQAVTQRTARPAASTATPAQPRASARARGLCEPGGGAANIALGSSVVAQVWLLATAAKPLLASPSRTTGPTVRRRSAATEQPRVEAGAVAGVAGRSFLVDLHE